MDSRNDDLGFDAEDLVARPVHGSITPTELRMLGLQLENVLDFSASISPIGPPPGIWEAMRCVDLTTYPDPECLELREVISSWLSATGFQLPITRIQVGNGSTELFHLITKAYLVARGPESAKAFLLGPTYSEYAGACRLAGAEILSLDARGGDGFRWDLEEAAACIDAAAPSLVIVCNPNNPTGVYLGRQDVEILAAAAARAESLLVVDEAYLSFVHGPWNSLELLERDNVVLVRSMTKDYALTGLRLGYALASESVAVNLRALQPDWSVNSLAQRAGIVALADPDYLQNARNAVCEAKEFLSQRLSRLGINVFPSEANFLLVEVGNAEVWRSELLLQGLVVRDCTSFGLPAYIRVGLRLLPDCRRLADVMEQLIAQLGLSP